MCIRSKLSNNLLHWLFACLLPCGIWANTRWVSAQEVFDGPGVILLKNDRFQAGIVHRFADAVQVELDARSKVTHSASDVEYIGKDLLAVYEYKLRKFARLGLGEHFQMTRWCLGAGLIDRATEHFAPLNKSRPDDPRVRQLGIELREKMLQDEAFRGFLGLAPTSKLPTLAPIGIGPVQTASADSSNADASKANHPLVLTQFTERIQPILINRCSQSACHGFSSSNRLKLIEPKGKAFARISAENLRSVLQFLTTNESNVSELLQKAISAHSLQKTPSVTASESELVTKLHNWVNFARNPVVTALAVDASQEMHPFGDGNRIGRDFPTPTALVPVPPGGANLREVPQGRVGGMSQVEGFQPPNISEIDALDEELRRILGEPPQTRRSHQHAGDPFDPAIFNQQVQRNASAALNR